MASCLIARLLSCQIVTVGILSRLLTTRVTSGHDGGQWHFRRNPGPGRAETRTVLAGLTKSPGQAQAAPYLTGGKIRGLAPYLFLLTN
jgi:hypothetical protein